MTVAKLQIHEDSQQYLRFPDYQWYLKECYRMGVYSTDDAVLFNPLSNYIHAATILFLFTHTPESELGNGLTNEYYLVPELIDTYCSPLRRNTFLLPETHMPIILPSYISEGVFDITPLGQSNCFTVLRLALSSMMRKPILAKNEIDLIDIMEPYTREILWFEIYAAVQSGTHTLDFKETPSVKLYYPEPFVATPSFVHEDVWFLHILRYAHWLWFFFISLIILFFITFIGTVRWCNYRVRPKRETRGVSRSKCADLITACVPVSWAISIIISESTDAVDYYDGFGTGELILGIRAYQWGWQYYYPKGIDLMHTVTPTSAIFTGNSLYSTVSSSNNAVSNKLWRHYQSSDLNNFSSSPNSVLLSPSINAKILKFVNTNTVGTNSLKSTDAFKRIQQFSKTNQTGLFTNISELGTRYSKIRSLYLREHSAAQSLGYGSTPQHSFTSAMATQAASNTYLEPKALNQYLSYSLAVGSPLYDTVISTPISQVNTEVVVPQAVNENNYFPSPTTYVDYDLTNYKHARQIENLYWQSKSSLHHIQPAPLSPETSSEPGSEEFYQKALDTAIFYQLGGLKNVVFSSDSFGNGYSSKNSLFYNPSLIMTNDYNNYFSKSFSSKWVTEYLDWKVWQSAVGLGSTHKLNPSSNSLLPISLNSLLDYYPLVGNHKHYLLDEVLPTTFSGYSSNEVEPAQSRVRCSNPFNIRSSAKESLTTYNALRKVFKARFDENRANIRFGDISGLGVPAPFINMTKVPFEGLLLKNVSNFFKKATYKSVMKPSFSNFITLDSLLNFYNSDLPFLKSLKSDASRYIWFDWGSRWERIEVQPSSIARYSLLGVPYSRNKFNYDSSNNPTSSKLNNSLMLEAETYYARLSRSRKNYITTWAYSPYIYSRITNNTSAGSTKGLDHRGTPATLSNLQTWKSTIKFLRSSKGVWNFNTIQLAGTNSPVQINVPLNVPGRAFTEPSTGVGTYTHTINKTASILAKRESFYLRYLSEKGYSFFLQPDLVSSPHNPLLKILKANHSFVDPSILAGESGRSFTNHYPISYQQFSILYSKLISTDKLPKYLTRLTQIMNYSEDYSTPNLQQNQYRPMRKGITSMVRLHATGAVAIPTEIRIHILASSKDVIHSWSIPSAGIKIDCIPGYSSHRVTIFFNSGIYWGQCMEICGRFHHWMPIVLYIMKRDTFFIWVTHFIHYNKQTATFTNIAHNNVTPSASGQTKPFYSYTLPNSQ